MATTSKSVEKKTENVNIEGNLKEVQELKDMMKAKEAENEELRNMIKQLSEIVKTTNSNVGAPVAPADKFDDDLVYINNNSIGSQLLTADRLGTVSTKILPNEKNRPLEKEFVRQIVQINKVRRLFEYGIIEFCDEKFYKVYGIVKRFDMSEKAVLEMFSKENLSATTRKITELLKRSDSSALEHELAYKTLDLYDRGMFPESDVVTIIATLDKIFCSKVNYSFEDLRANLQYKRGEY
nr:MAG TPA: hypothetical protein [Bacteriophage sp.]